MGQPSKISYKKSLVWTTPERSEWCMSYSKVCYCYQQ